MNEDKRKENRDFALVKRALGFHGKPMKMTWEDECGIEDLQRIGFSGDDSDYIVYAERQKHFTFQDRAKRLKLHQFLARKSENLYDSDRLKSNQHEQIMKKEKCLSLCAQIPSYELVMDRTRLSDKSNILRHVLEYLQPGNLIYGLVLRGRNSMTSTAPVLVKVLCTAEPTVRVLADTNLKAFIPSQYFGTPPMDKNGKVRLIATNDYVCCEIHELSIDADRMTLSLEGGNSKCRHYKIGIVNAEELPLLYRKSLENPDFGYESFLKCFKKYENPNYDALYTLNDLNVHDNFTMMGCLQYEFPQKDYAKELRQVQATRWAFRSVANGIEYFKIGKDVEAFQCLNKALTIDPRNVEGLVARGALYANKGSFLKALEDFDKALKLNSYHVNARKYMSETLVALGRNYETNKRCEDAAKAYRECLNVMPKHRQARVLLVALAESTGFGADNIPSTPSSSSSLTQQSLENENSESNDIRPSSRESSPQTSISDESCQRDEMLEADSREESNSRRSSSKSCSGRSTNSGSRSGRPSSTISTTNSSCSNESWANRRNHIMEARHHRYQRRRRLQRRRRDYEANRRQISSSSSNESNMYSSDQISERGGSSSDFSDEYASKRSTRKRYHRDDGHRRYSDSTVSTGSVSMDEREAHSDISHDGKIDGEEDQRSMTDSFDIEANEFKLEEIDDPIKWRKMHHESVSTVEQQRKPQSDPSTLATNEKKTSASSPACLLSADKTKPDSLQEHCNLSEINVPAPDHIVENQLNENFKIYEKSIQEIKKRHDHFQLATGEDTEVGKKSPTTTRRGTELKANTITPGMGIGGIDGFMGGARMAPGMFGSDGLLIAGMIPKMTLGAAIVLPPGADNSKFSFQMRKPVKMDKFGLVRLATPELKKSASSSSGRRSRTRSVSRFHSRSSSRSRFRRCRRRYSPSMSRSRTRSRSCSRTRTHSRTGSRSRTCSRSRERRAGYCNKYANRSLRSGSHSRSRSRTNTRSRSRSPEHRQMQRNDRSMRNMSGSPSQARSRNLMCSGTGGGGGVFRRHRAVGGVNYYQRSPHSLFQNRRYMPVNSHQHQGQRNRYRFSPTPHMNRSIRRRSHDRRPSLRIRAPRVHTNRTWQRSQSGSIADSSALARPSPSPTSTPEEREKEKVATTRWDLQDSAKVEENKVTEDPSIEEIDEIINKVQRERKQEIIRRDKEILKKPAEGGNF